MAEIHSRCAFLGYEFPDEELGPTEDNPADEFQMGRFLIIEATFSDSGRVWHATGPIMDTNELGRLIDWLDAIINKRCSMSGVYFTERDLEFSCDEAQSRLMVHIFEDFLPTWCEKDSLTLEFPLADVNLPIVTSDLKDQLKRFPGRPPDASGVLPVQ